MSPEAPEIIATSIAGSFLPRLRRTHRLRKIAVFAGPPGIGKSTALTAFRTEDPACVAMVSVPPGPKGGLKPSAVLQLVIEALGELTDGAWRDRVPNGYMELRNRVFSLVCQWAGLSAAEVRRDELQADQFAPLTLIFDEAQNLSREAIETLRYLNDAAPGYSPLPIGLIFVGNNEFVLKSDRGGQSVLTAAFADRAEYIETFAYSDVTDDDLTLFFEARGIHDAKALQLVVQHFGASRPDRSFRRAGRLADELAEEAGDGGVTAAVVRDVLSLGAAA